VGGWLFATVVGATQPPLLDNLLSRLATIFSWFGGGLLFPPPPLLTVSELLEFEQLSYKLHKQAECKFNESLNYTTYS
jgi:hypothetical protein